MSGLFAPMSTGCQPISLVRAGIDAGAQRVRELRAEADAEHGTVERDRLGG